MDHFSKTISSSFFVFPSLPYSLWLLCLFFFPPNRSQTSQSINQTLNRSWFHLSLLMFFSIFAFRTGWKKKKWAYFDKEWVENRESWRCKKCIWKKNIQCVQYWVHRSLFKKKKDVAIHLIPSHRLPGRSCKTEWSEVTRSVTERTARAATANTALWRWRPPETVRCTRWTTSRSSPSTAWWFKPSTELAPGPPALRSMRLHLKMVRRSHYTGNGHNNQCAYFMSCVEKSHVWTTTGFCRAVQWV